MSYRIPLYNEKLQKTGFIDSNGMVLRKFISDPENQQLKIPPAWAVDTAHLDMLEELGGTVIVLAFRGMNQLGTRLWLFRERGFAVDRGHGLQTALRLDDWSVYDGARAAHENGATKTMYKQLSQQAQGL